MKIVNETFTCAECKRELPVSKNMATGYANTAGMDVICYDCCAVIDVKYMCDNGRIVLYLTSAGYVITNWPGTLHLVTYKIRTSKHNIAGTRLDVWFIGPDGRKWHGVSFGDSQICRCNRLKHKKGIASPLPKTSYLKPYPYENCSTN